MNTLFIAIAFIAGYVLRWLYDRSIFILIRSIIKEIQSDLNNLQHTNDANKKDLIKKIRDLKAKIDGDDNFILTDDELNEIKATDYPK